MTMTATLLFLVALTCVLLIAAASYLSRNALWRGGLVLALAAGLTATSALAIYPALRLTDRASDASGRLAEIEQLRADRDELLTQLEQRVRDNEALAKTNAFFSKLHKERLTRISEEVHGVMDVVLGPQSGIVLQRDATPVDFTSFLDGPSGFDSIIADVRRLKGLRLRAPDETSTATYAMLAPAGSNDAGTTGMVIDQPRSDPIGGAPAKGDISPIEPSLAMQQRDTLAVLRKAMDQKLSANTYRIEPLPDGELVLGRPGKYYAVHLVNAKSGERFTFDSGKYTFQSSRAAYTASFKAFSGDILSVLDGRSRFDLFVRGNADAQAYEGEREPGYDIKKVAYLPSSRGRYLNSAAIVTMPPTVRNVDLPNLRGEYLRGHLAGLYPSHPPIVLEGVVQKKESPAARYTELILFVAW